MVAGATASWEGTMATAMIASTVEGGAAAGIVVIASTVATTITVRWILGGKMQGYI